MPGILSGMAGTGLGLLNMFQPDNTPFNGTVGRLASSLSIMNPQAGQAYMQQRMLPAEYQSLASNPNIGPRNAMLFMLHPELLNTLAKPTAVQAGGSLEAPLNLLGGGSAAPQPQQSSGASSPQVPSLAQQVGQDGTTGIQPQPSQMPAPGQSQPQQNQGPGLNIQNKNGVLSDQELMPLVEQYLRGKDDAFNVFGRTMTGPGGMNRARAMQLVSQAMTQRGMTSQDLAANQMKYQGLKGTINDIYKTNNALNTGVGHMGQLLDVFNNLGNASFKPSNYVKNLLGDILGKAGPVNYEAVAQRVAPEITRIWRGTGGTGEEITRDLETLSKSNSPEQGVGAISNIAKMMGSKMDTNNYQFESVFGPHSGDFMVSPTNRALLQKLESAAQPHQQGTAGPSPKAVEALKAHPEKRGEFDAKYGPGASQKVLGNGQLL